VMRVAAEKARRRREAEARRARVERWAEDSGNAALAGRELPPAEVLAAGDRVNAWATALKEAGLPGSTDQLRARAFLDLLLGVDSRPRPGAGDGGCGGCGGEDAGAAEPGDGTRAGDGESDGGADRGGEDGKGASTGGRGTEGGGGPGPAGTGGAPGGLGPGPLAGLVPPAFAAHVNLTVPLATLLGLAGRPGELPGIGPVDPDPEANTLDRYQIRASADPGRRISTSPACGTAA
jgi:hypothetical protein